MIDNSKPAKKYYVATRSQINEFHTIHMKGCPFMPDDNKRIYLGTFVSGEDASLEARKFYPKITPCRFCLKEAEKHAVITGTFKSLIPSPEQLTSFAGSAMLCFLN